MHVVAHSVEEMTEEERQLCRQIAQDRKQTTKQQTAAINARMDQVHDVFVGNDTEYHFTDISHWDPHRPSSLTGADQWHEGGL